MRIDPNHKHMALLPPVPAAGIDAKGPIALGSLAYRSGDAWGAFTKWLPIAEGGDVLKQTTGLDRNSTCLLSDIDYETIRMGRIHEQNFDPGADLCNASPACKTVLLESLRCLAQTDTLLA